MSIPVQCTQEIPVYFREKPQPLTQNPAAQCGIDCLSSNMGTFSDLLAEDMSRLCMNAPHRRKGDGELELNVAPLLTLDSSRWQGASSNELKNPGPADHPGRERTRHTVRVGVFSRNKSQPVATGFPNLSIFYVSPHKLPVLYSVFVSDANVRLSLPAR